MRDLAKLFFVFFMDGRQLLLNLLTLMSESQETNSNQKIKAVFAPVVVQNRRH